MDKFEALPIGCAMSRLAVCALTAPDGFDVFLRYSGHIHGVNVRVKAMAEYADGAPSNTVFERTVYVDHDDHINQLNACCYDLQELLARNPREVLDEHNQQQEAA